MLINGTEFLVSKKNLKNVHNLTVKKKERDNYECWSKSDRDGRPFFNAALERMASITEPIIK